MPRNSGRSRKRKFMGNQFMSDRDKPKKSKRSGASTSKSASEKSERRISASARKIGSGSLTTNRKQSNVSGYRFVDIDILGEVFEEMICKECFDKNLVFSELAFKRRGCASFFRLFCKSCGWELKFYTSKTTKQFFEVNRRFVYSMRTIGQGQASAKRFCGIMNMPAPPLPNAFDRHNKALAKVAKSCAQEAMLEAAKELFKIKVKKSESVAQCGVSCDGTWQKRGHSSLNGCVTAISMDTGKCLDVAIMSKNCLGCKKLEEKNHADEYQVLKAEHDISGKCTANYHGSSPAMETEGIKKIFSRSEQKYSLQYTEYYGDGDSKGYNVVRNTYSEKGVEVVKKECVGHVQKRVGTALRKLKKEKKGMGG